MPVTQCKVVPNMPRRNKNSPAIWDHTEMASRLYSNQLKIVLDLATQEWNGPNDHSVNPPTFKMWEIVLPNPLE